MLLGFSKPSAFTDLGNWNFVLNMIPRTGVAWGWLSLLLSVIGISIEISERLLTDDITHARHRTYL
jgi:hypothetical protein